MTWIIDIKILILSYRVLPNFVFLSFKASCNFWEEIKKKCRLKLEKWNGTRCLFIDINKTYRWVLTSLHVNNWGIKLVRIQLYSCRHFIHLIPDISYHSVLLRLSKIGISKMKWKEYPFKNRLVILLSVDWIWQWDSTMYNLVWEKCMKIVS